MKKIPKKRAVLENSSKHVTDIQLLLRYYVSLTKLDQTAIAALTTIPGYGIAPGAFDPVTFTCVVLGTALLSAAAFTLNQDLEVPYDSQMNRTKNRVLVRSYLTHLHASMFAVCCASIGLTTIYFGTNPLTFALGAANLILHTAIYKPMKRHSSANSRKASFIGALLLLMGWSACTGSLSAGSVLLSAIIYSWKFLQCTALSWSSRPDYSRVGYRMTSMIVPVICRREVLRHSVVLLVLCTCAPLLDLIECAFAFDSFPLNCYLIYHAWKFYKEGDNQSSQELFRFTLIYLLALMFLMLVGKKYTSIDDKHEIVP